MKNIRKHMDFLPLKKEDEVIIIDVMVDAINNSNRELESLRIALSQRLPQGEPKKIDPRHIC